MQPPAAGTIPRRVLVVDDDTVARQRMAQVLANGHMEVMQAADGQEALSMICRQWFPVVITDWEMPLMDGIELTQRIRALAVDPIYVMMATASEVGMDFERGYCAGVDHYLSKKASDAVLVERANAGLKAIALRRSNRRQRGNDAVITVDLASGAHTARHLVGRLSAEIMLAQRLGRPLDILVLGVDPEKNFVEAGVSDSQLSAVLEAVRIAVRSQGDWVAWLHAVGQGQRFAIVMPDATQNTAASVEQRIRNAFAAGGAGMPQLSFGSVSFKPQANAVVPAALELLGIGERHRRGLQGPARSQIEAVQAK